ANVYPSWEFLACGLGEGAPRACRHCPVEWESSLHKIGYCPVVQDARIKRHLVWIAEERNGFQTGWEVFLEPHPRDFTEELFKPHLVLGKGVHAKVVDITVRYSQLTTWSDVATKKARKYQHLVPDVRALTSSTETEFLGFPIGARGKFYKGNERLLSELGLSTSQSKRMVRVFSQRALLSSVDII
ncbi:PO22 protein, partial [Nothoprocta pentlandii]|nr:PO22 protein [Nothoprocta pentlandii]